MGSNDTDVLLALCTGDDQLDGATGINSALKETTVFTEISYKVSALSRDIQIDATIGTACN